MSVLNEMWPGFVLNLTSAIIIIGLIYYPSNHAKKDYIFTFFSFNILIYFVSGLLRDVQLTIGFGFGLLAVFTTLRYRTVRIPIKEMTYLFICITFPFMNTLFMATRITFQELIIVDTFVIGAIFLLERSWGIPYYSSKQILYEKIDLIRPENYAQLLDDIRLRTGLDVQRCDIEEIDFLRDTATLTIYFQDISPDESS